jgi:multidrug resistance protein
MHKHTCTRTAMFDSNSKQPGNPYSLKTTQRIAGSAQSEEKYFSSPSIITPARVKLREQTLKRVHGVPVYSYRAEDALSSCSGNSTTLVNNEKDEQFENIPLQDIMDNNEGIEIEWDGTDDGEDNRRMPTFRKWLIVILLTFSTFQLTCLSSVWSEANVAIMNYYRVARPVATLGITLFVLGMGTGPLFLAPLSEKFGRRPVYIFGFLFYCCFQIPTLVGRNIETLLVGRFFSGFAGSAFLTVVSGTISDLFVNEELGGPMMLFSLAPFLGPLIGPLLGAFITDGLGFKWVFRIMMIWSVSLFILSLLAIPETYGPILLVNKAKRIRHTSRNPNFYAPMERMQQNTLVMLLSGFTRPMKLLILDPVISILSLYSGFLMATVYLFFVAFPIVFENVYGFEKHIEGLTYLGMAIGALLGAFTQPIWSKTYKNLISSHYGNSHSEFWLVQMMFGSFFVPVGLLFFGWTNFRRIHWIIPIVGSGVFHFGTTLIFSGLFLYLVDGYRLYAASAMATNTCVRCILASVFPLFGVPLFTKFGYHWAPTLLAVIATVMLPIPFVFFFFGQQIRRRSRYSSSWDKPTRS